MFEIKVLDQKRVATGQKKDIKSRKPVWVHVTSPKNSDWAQLADFCGIEVGELKRFIIASERPILRDVGNYTAVTLRMPFLTNGNILTKPSVFLVSETKREFYSISLNPTPAVERVRDLSADALERMFRSGPTSMLLGVTGEILTSFRDVLEHVSEETEKIEKSVLDTKHSRDITIKIFQLQKTLVYFLRALFADQQVISALEKGHGRFINSLYSPQFRVIFEDIEHLEDLASIYRETLSSLLEVHLSSINNNLNVVMKKFTSWGAIILVPSLIAGIWGMNFRYIPFFEHGIGFFIPLALMALSVIFLYIYFSQKDWL